jgi:hypothetical protein
MFANIARMMRRIHVSDPDLELIEEACRRLNNLYRNDAARQENPLMRRLLIETAEKYERMADRMKRFRET